MQQLCQSILSLPAVQQLKGALESGRAPVAVSGVMAVHKAHLAAALRTQQPDVPMLIVTADEPDARRMQEDVSAFLGQEVLRLSSRELILHAMAGVSRTLEQQRLQTLWALRSGAPVVVVAEMEALMLYTMPPQVLEEAVVRLSDEGEYDMEQLCLRLTRLGYQCVTQVEAPGQFARRGGILDVFSPGQSAPARLELFGDAVDTLALFDPKSQRRGAAVCQVVCLPVREALPSLAVRPLEPLLAQYEKKSEGNQLLRQTLREDRQALESEGLFAAADRYLPLMYPPATALAYLPPQALVLVDDGPRVRERLRRGAQQLQQEATALLEQGKLLSDCCAFSPSYGQVMGELAARRTVVMDAFLVTHVDLPPKLLCPVTAKALPPYGGNVDVAVGDMEHYRKNRFSTLVLCSSESRCQRMLQLLTEHGIPASHSQALPPPGGVAVAEGALSSGMEYPDLKLAVLTEGQMVMAAAKKRRRHKTLARDRVRAVSDLTVGDLVVHENHGIARFCGLSAMTVDGVQRDYIKLAFAGTDVLYVPATGLDMIAKYIGAGGEDSRVAVSKLGGAQWDKARSRARAAAKKLAIGLIELYAQRESAPGIAFPPDDALQRQFEEGFSYEETEDQLRAAQEIKRDMQRPRPMDRLLCGDVGFGKTEVALRAVMKCILGGYQAAILAPTTVLARQHYLTAMQRFADFPVRVALLSRMCTAAQQKKILEQCRAGQIDLLVGTHKLLNKKLKFHRLGLLVVDEEQRFGVGHKETLKDMTRQVDVLTLSATPIPRTLNMALSGIRDMSSLEQAPADRYPVQTYVLEYDRTVVMDAMERELSRGGQCYYLHNRVESIDRCAARIQQQLPQATVAVAHGKMTQTELSRVMNAMAEGEADILVCTTIIETGLDIPNVNTLIMEDSDRFGLSQLHQIRGRVGRSTRRAYAYLTYPRGKALTEVSQKRLAAVREFAEFGSGFQIAMRDLEIRGAGNLLGAEQSGHMMSVGYDLYLKLLEEAVREMKGDARETAVECAADLPVSAGIPDTYVPDTGMRVELYRRMAMIRTPEEKMDMLDELIDRFGEPPRQTVALCDIALLRTRAGALGIREIAARDGRLRLVFQAADFALLSAVCARKEYRGRLLLDAGESAALALRLRSGEEILPTATALVDACQSARQELQSQPPAQ